MTLSRNDTAFLKGIAILLIVMHNFCHWLPGCVAENEYTFDAGRIGQYLQYISEGGPHLLLNFFSHYGHYGVPLFLFLSGYGLVKKYEGTKTMHCATKTALTFIWSHAVKLWRLMIPAIAILWLCQETIGKGWHTQTDDLVKMVTYTANLFYNRDLILGPWWFFSLIMQLYIVYRLVFYPTRHWMHARLGRLSPHLMPAIVVLACFALQCWLYYTDVRMTPDWQFHLHDMSPRHWDLFNYCRYNFPGSMLPFVLGIAMARDEQWSERSNDTTPSEAKRGPLLVTAAAGTTLLLLSAGWSALWQLSPIFLLMALVPCAVLVKSEVVRRPLMWVGSISAAVFAIHPIVRAFTIGYAKHAEQQGQWIATWGYFLFYIAISLIAAWIFTFITNKILTYVR